MQGNETREDWTLYEPGNRTKGDPMSRGGWGTRRKVWRRGVETAKVGNEAGDRARARLCMVSVQDLLSWRMAQVSER